MKNDILNIIEKNRDNIKGKWISNLAYVYGDKLAELQPERFIDSAISNIASIQEKNDYSSVNKYLIETCNYFHLLGITLLDASQFFYFGKVSIMHFCKDEKGDPGKIFFTKKNIEIIVEHFFSQFSLLFNEFQGKKNEKEENDLSVLYGFEGGKKKSFSQSSSIAIISVSEIGKIVFFSPGAESILGYSEADVLGKDYHMIQKLLAVKKRDAFWHPLIIL